ncbi:Deoxyguanosinetriphosphate triphosphohydrolase-like protein [bioreactor metagenome]|uniref:Deoxyguanosinetriphosphate triphosphohydrolase-like protein n=1 Tax=bioreactor metagenome TaxID=1076179 RepID=A0A645F224_9ZZZZ
MSPLMDKTFKILREFMFEKVYLSERALKERNKVFHIISAMYGYFLKNPDEMPAEFLKLLDMGEVKEAVACDYIAGMTDHFAIQKYKELFVPNPWDVF